MVSKKISKAAASCMFGLMAFSSVVPYAAAVSTEVTPAQPEPVITPVVEETPQETKEHGMIEFESRKVAKTGLSISPGERSETVKALKEVLKGYDMVTHTQSRSEVMDLYDGRMQVLVQTLCEFCSYENPGNVIDDCVSYIINNLKELSPEMISDIQTAYKVNLKASGKDGTVEHDGDTNPYYLFLQTDPEWASNPYPYVTRQSSMKEAACGPTSMSIILSSYFHKEILPTEVASFSVANGHRQSSGTATSLFPHAARTWGMPEPVTVYGGSIDQVAAGIKNNGNMAIALMGVGHFTSIGHYVALVDVVERNGKEYLLVADPNYPNYNYRDLGSLMIDDDPTDGFVLADPSLFRREAQEITWFQCDFDTVPAVYKTTEDEILLANYTEEEFLSMIPEATVEVIKEDTLGRLTENKQNDDYASSISSVPIRLAIEMGRIAGKADEMLSR